MLLGITKRQTKDFDSELNANCWHPQVGFLITITIIIIVVLPAAISTHVLRPAAPDVAGRLRPTCPIVPPPEVEKPMYQ